jgi:hypothetical protein
MKGNRMKAHASFFIILTSLTIIQTDLAPASAACVAPPNGLIGWWSGDATANDLAATNHGISQNGATYAVGKVGWAFSFDGVDDYIQIGAPTSLVMTTSMSAEAWIYPTGPGSGAANNGGIIINKEGEYEFCRFSDGTLAVALANTTPGWAWINSQVMAPLSQWTHAAFTYDGSVLKLYTNGTLAFSTNATGNIGDYHPGTNDFRIGGRQLGGHLLRRRGGHVHDRHVGGIGSLLHRF